MHIKYVEESMLVDDIVYSKKLFGFQFNFRDKRFQALKLLYDCKNIVVILRLGSQEVLECPLEYEFLRENSDKTTLETTLLRLTTNHVK